MGHKRKYKKSLKSRLNGLEAKPKKIAPKSTSTESSNIVIEQQKPQNLIDIVLDKINKIFNWQAALIIVIVGLGVFSTGVTNPFQGDDTLQIVNNIPVHSIANIKLFFEGGTFYNGRGLAPLNGSFFRPLMLTCFSLLYTIFGAHPLYFHLLQLFICIGSTILLYLFFRYSFKPALALSLSLLFLIHPLDAQVVDAIPNLQDALFFFFGILALWLLVRFNSIRSLFLVVVSLFLSLLAKETGIAFVAMSLVYLYWWDRKRLLPFLYIFALPFVLYLALRIHAVGFKPPTRDAPIDNLSLLGRILTVPSIVLFYLSKLIFPWKLASAYYWTDSTFSISHVILPLFIDSAVVVTAVIAGIRLREKASKAKYITYVFFGIWVVLGLLIYSQIIPLDFTASAPWFYFSMAGVLGMIGIVIDSHIVRIRTNWPYLLLLILLIFFGTDSALWAFNYRSAYALASYDIKTSPDDYLAYNTMAISFEAQNEYREAAIDAQKSVNIYPTFVAYNTLGTSLAALRDYSGATNAFNTGLKYGALDSIYENLAQMTLVYGNKATDTQILYRALYQNPDDPYLWYFFALFEQKYGNNNIAKIAISTAEKHGLTVPESIYTDIMNNSNSFMVDLPGLGEDVTI